MAIMNNATRIFIARDNVASTDLAYICFAGAFDALLDGVVSPSLLRADDFMLRFRAAIVMIHIFSAVANDKTQLFASQRQMTNKLL